jgi:hypothetical protein
VISLNICFEGLIVWVFHIHIKQKIAWCGFAAPGNLLSEGFISLAEISAPSKRI